ncbi:hypothetical protein OQA88_10565 [Cercophora sp. LCS_1]
MTVYPSYPFASQSWLQMGCAEDDGARETGAGGNQSGQDPEKEEGESKAWIAGAVIGPVVALLGVGAAAFWVGRRKGGKEGVVQQVSVLPTYEEREVVMLQSPSKGSAVLVTKEDKDDVGGHGILELDSVPVRSGEKRG